MTIDSNSWGHTDLLDTDYEQLEFNKNFDYKHDVYSSILDTEANYNLLLNFPDDEQDTLYAYEDEQEIADTNATDEDDELNERNSYRDRNLDDAYYLI